MAPARVPAVLAVESHPWTAPYAVRFLIHDRDAIFSQTLDREIRHLGLRVLKTPPHSPQANVLCERLLGTLQPLETLDFPEP